ncbi:MAG TPA: tRNA (adenosine(37)-N6)-threonylcarbamoyltransferase complex ATPase subunit type 1 TsaE [Candidatus Paceibacterota bacterium]|nr:tRNA (adenosine(37)-N6)-threonylcarbamoyltransferase complex ATPase subunit type 1 TsaE [Candidatus Paceibacterota bacterium]
MISHSIEDTKKIAEIFVKDVMTHGVKKRATLVGFYGDLGSGKTTFIQNAAHELGVIEDVTSPTFIIERIYKTKNPVFKTLIHIDAYRLDSGEDLKKLGFEEILKNPDALIFIEWPERVIEILPEHIRVNCGFVSESKRSYEIIFNDQ